MQPSVFSTQPAGGRSAAVGSFTRAQSVQASSSNANTGAESDSWIEVASHPSDSQYTSSSDDHIITAGLRISQTRRRRRGTTRPTTRSQEPLEPESSSEEEDDEGEAEDMGSLIHSMTMSSDDYSSPDDDDDESDDEASASDSNVGERAVLSSVPTQERPGAPYRRAQTTPSASSGGRSHAYAGSNSFAPNHAADHDAVLRASLSTLLSCAAAARGLPKSSQSQTVQTGQPQQGGRVAVDSLTLVREGTEPSNSTGKPRSLSITSTSTTPASRSPSSEQLAKKDSKKSSKRPTTKSSSKPKRRSRSQTRDSADNEIMSLSNISYMTLAISAGAIVVLSAITFSAGYALGKEVGKGESSILSSVSRSEGSKAALKGTGRSIRMGTRFTSIAAF